MHRTSNIIEIIVFNRKQKKCKYFKNRNYYAIINILLKKTFCTFLFQRFISSQSINKTNYFQNVSATLPVYISRNPNVFPALCSLEPRSQLDLFVESPHYQGPRTGPAATPSCHQNPGFHSSQCLFLRFYHLRDQKPCLESQCYHLRDWKPCPELQCYHLRDQKPCLELQCYHLRDWKP